MHENAALFVQAGVKAGSGDARPPAAVNVAGLAAHQGRIFRWVSAIVEKGSQKFIHLDTLGQLEDDLYWLKPGAERPSNSRRRSEAKVWNWFDRQARRPGGGTGGAGP